MRRAAGAPRKLAPGHESLLVVVACSAPPDGRARWTLELLADEVVRLTAHRTLSRDTVRRRLAEVALKPWQKKVWCIPTLTAEYVARMEDLLALNAEPPDPRRPGGAWLKLERAGSCFTIVGLLCDVRSVAVARSVSGDALQAPHQRRQ